MANAAELGITIKDPAIQDAIRSADIQVANHAAEISLPIAHISEGIEASGLEMADIRDRVARVQKMIVGRAKERYPYVPDPVEARNTGALREIKPEEEPFILSPTHITTGKKGEKLVSARLYGMTNLSEL